MASDLRTSVSQKNILGVTGLGVVLVAIAFVLGVAVGKQGAALRHAAQKGLDEDLKDLPEPLADQLKALEGEGQEKMVPAPKVEVEAPKEEAKPEAPAGPRFTLQLVATPDAAEAKRVAAKAKAAGYGTVLVKDRKILKVRLSEPASREAMDEAAQKLRKAGLKTALIKVE